MKKILTIVAIALIAMVSCKKENIEKPTQNVSINLTVSPKAGFDSNNSGTKAIKSGWENGDKIHLIFTDETNEEARKEALKDAQYVIMTYNGSNWTVTEGQENLNKITKNGVVAAVYDSQDFTLEYSYSIYFGQYWSYYDAYGEKQSTNWTAYTLSGNTITTDLQFILRTDIKVTMTNIDTSKEWLLITNQEEDVYIAEQDGLWILSNSISPATTGTEVHGVIENEGVAFYGGLGNTSKTVKLELKNETDNKSYTISFPEEKKFSNNKAFKIAGPELDAEGNITTAHGWSAK